MICKYLFIFTDFRKNRPIERLSVDSAVNRLSVNSAGVVALPHDDRHIRLLTVSSMSMFQIELYLDFFESNAS